MERQVSCSASWLKCHLPTFDDDEVTEAKQDSDDGECRRDAIVVDCRPTEAYNSTHIRGAVSLSLPTLMTRRLARRQLAACTVIGLVELQQQQQRRRQQLTTDDWRQRAVVFYDDSTSVSQPPTNNPSCLVAMLAQRFNDDGHRAMILDGQFYHHTPTTCTICRTGNKLLLTSSVINKNRLERIFS